MYLDGCIPVYRGMLFRIRWMQKRVEVHHYTKMRPALKKRQGSVMFLVLLDNSGGEEVGVF